MTVGLSASSTFWPLSQAIDEAADYLSRVNANDGRFTYREFLDGRRVSPRKYNILRHAGSIYALADYHSHTTDAAARAKAAGTMARASQYLVTRYIRPVPNNPDLAAVWSDPKEEGGERPSPASAPRRGSALRYLWATIAVAACTLACFGLFQFFAAANLVMVYLGCVVAVSLAWGRGPSILASILSVAAFDFLFVPPHNTFAVADTEYLVTFGVMLITGVVISELTARC